MRKTKEIETRKGEKLISSSPLSPPPISNFVLIGSKVNDVKFLELRLFCLQEEEKSKD